MSPLFTDGTLSSNNDLQSGGGIKSVDELVNPPQTPKCLPP